MQRLAHQGVMGTREEEEEEAGGNVVLDVGFVFSFGLQHSA